MSNSFQLQTLWKIHDTHSNSTLHHIASGGPTCICNTK